MGTHQLAGSSPAKGVSFAGCLVLGVAGPRQCLWGGGLSWLHVLGCVFYYIFSGAGIFYFFCAVDMCWDMLDVLVWDFVFSYICL